VTFQNEGALLYPELYPTDETTPPPNPVPAGTPRLAALVEPVRGDRPRPVRVRVRVRGTDDEPEHSHELLQGTDPTTMPDCMFWSDGAVETLMLPYYASVKASSSLYYTALLMGRWDGLIAPDDTTPDVAKAMQRRLPDLFGAAVPSRVPADGHVSRVYTITHLPRSEYATYPGGVEEGVEARTVVLALEDRRTARYDLRGNALPVPGSAQRPDAAAGEKRSRKSTSRAT
ncbi:MAG TPA: hypothetical protein VM759_06025, partial [Longimicrobium sp.]|nr:hypothetical protein [Longimicrobium sp.]